MHLTRFRVVKGVTGVVSQDDLVPVAAFHSFQNGGQQMLCGVDGAGLVITTSGFRHPQREPGVRIIPTHPEKSQVLMDGGVHSSRAYSGHDRHPFGGPWRICSKGD